MIDWTTILLGWLGLVASFFLGWRWSVRHRDAGIVDVLWAFTLAGLVVWYAFAGSGDGDGVCSLASAPGSGDCAWAGTFSGGCVAMGRKIPATLIYARIGAIRPIETSSSFSRRKGSQISFLRFPFTC